MNILHCCLSNFYIDNYNYQENVLPRLNKEDGHEVLIIASTETFINNSELGYVNPHSYETEYGVPIIRVPYYHIFNSFVSRKIRKYRGVSTLIDQYKPDVIIFHGTCASELLTISKYVRKNKEVKLYVDSHGDFNNSARNFFSKQLLHRMFYKRILLKSMDSIEKVFYISLETYDFLHDFYRVPYSKLEFYPLGGILYEEYEYEKRRKDTREKLSLDEKDILIVHSGKMDINKRTHELLHALKKIKSDNLKLVLIGSIPTEMQDIILPLIDNDHRVKFLGWKNKDELIECLCAADLYAQPGSQSATMQNAICCGCPVILYPHKSHSIFLKGNGFYAKSTDDIVNALNTIKDNPEILKEMREASYKVAHDILDYKKLAARLYK